MIHLSYANTLDQNNRKTRLLMIASNLSKAIKNQLEKSQDVDQY